MTIGLLAAVFAATCLIATLAFLSLIRWVMQAHSRERALLMNQLLHATGKTWIAPPAEIPAVSDASPAVAREKVIRFVDSPEQFPAAV